MQAENSPPPPPPPPPSHFSNGPSLNLFGTQTFNGSGGSRERARGARLPLFFDQNEARKAEQKFFEDGPTALSQSLNDRPPPSLSEGLDSPLKGDFLTLYALVGKWYRAGTLVTS